MGNYVNEQIVMQYYIDQMDADRIDFLKGKETAKAEIKASIQTLMSAENMNEKIMIACTLWKQLFEAAMSSISTNKQGYDKLFKYFDSYVEFEELIFASDSFYRDHTLHCIWVYFLGEYIKKQEEFAPLFYDQKQTIITFEALKELHERFDFLDEKSADRVNMLLKFLTNFDELTDAIDCVSALTHDLGYPIKKIEKINKSIQKVLPFFAINNFDNFKFEYNNIQQEFINNFIQTLCIDLNMNIDASQMSIAEQNALNEMLNKMFFLSPNGMATGINHEEVDKLSKSDFDSLRGKIKLKTFKSVDDSLKQLFLNDFENYQHGIMSAFILAKNVPTFMENYQGNSEYIRTSNHDLHALAVTEIMQSISFHTCEAVKIGTLTSTTFLTLVDELEEFSRISRASQNREYVKEFCETNLGMSEDGWLSVDFTFTNQDLDNLDPEIAFKGRCKRFLTLFNIPEMSPNLKIRLRCIGELATDKNTYMLEIANKHAVISINGEAQNIPKYLKSNQFYTSEEYANL